MVKRSRRISDKLLQQQKQQKQPKKHRHENININKNDDEIIIEDDNKKELVSEDACFICKDGGLLIVCDFKDCLKAYHPNCVGQEEATEETDAQWICGWHSCLVCKNSPKYQCYCCPNAVCQSCFKDASFARVKGTKGICNNCLNLALLREEGLDADSDGEKVDFKDYDTYEGLFREYWDILKEKEGLTLDDLHNADVQIKKGQNAKVQGPKPESDSDESVKEEENRESSPGEGGDHDSDDDAIVQPVVPLVVQPVATKTKPKPKRSAKKKKGSSRIEYDGWASKSLIEFLPAVGVDDASKKLSHNYVTSLIVKYVQENKLFHPEKRKMVVCDLRLELFLKRKTISIYKIHDAIEAHFRENLGQSEDEEDSSGGEENNSSLPTKKQAWWRSAGSLPSFQQQGSLMEKYQQNDAVLEEPKKIDTSNPPVEVQVVYSHFASIVPQNMKFVYLKKSFVENLLEKFETFESKVTGSFVKVKSEPFDPKHPFLLLPVTGIKEVSGDRNKKVLLQVSNLTKDIPLSMLSNDDISEDDCKDLCQKIEGGLIPKPTVVELETKAKDLHEDMTKHAISRELSILKHRIDLANEKGRRADLYDFRKRRDLLQSEEEQVRLLNELPRIIAEVIEIKPDSEEAENNDDAEILPSNDPSDDKSSDSKLESCLPSDDKSSDSKLESCLTA